MRRVKYIYVLTIGILIYGCEAEIPARNVPINWISIYILPIAEKVCRRSLSSYMAELGQGAIRTIGDRNR